MENLTLLKAVTFDVFGTVVDWRTSIAREVEGLAVKKQFVVDGERFADAWRNLYQPSMKKVRDGKMPWTVLDDLHRTNLLEVLEAFGIDQLSEEEIEHLNRAWHRLDPWPDAVAGLQRLKQHYIIGTLSNGNVALIVNMAKFSGLPWDVVLGAEIARHYKPQPEAYLKSAEILGWSRENACWSLPTMAISRLLGVAGFKRLLCRGRQSMDQSRPPISPLNMTVTWWLATL